MFELPDNIETYYSLDQSLRDKMHMIDDMLDQLGERLDWNFTVDFQIIKADKKSSLYAVSIIAGEPDDQDSPILFSTASVDEALIRLQVYLEVMEKLDISHISRSEEYYQQALDKMVTYYNETCESLLHEIILENFFTFNDTLSTQA